jgi:hyperpolarization activated cyclic nucleotide-gated potassium channel 2
MRLLKLIRLAKVTRILIKLEDFISSSLLSTLLHFIKLNLLTFLVAHWTACIWFYVANDSGLDNSETWISSDDNLKSSKLLDLYVASLYWAFTTISTVGYGDIVPITIEEKIVCCFTMLLACGVFAFTLASVGDFVESQTKKSSLYRSHLEMMNYFLINRNIPEGLQARARQYLEYSWSLQSTHNNNDMDFLSMLSEPLRDEVNMIVIGKILQHYKLFRVFETSFIAGLTKSVKFEFFAPQDVIFNQGEVGETIYFVKSGSVDLYDRTSKTTFCIVRTSKVFGEVGFLLDYLRSLSARTIEYSELITLRNTTFASVIERFPKACLDLRNALRSCRGGNLTAIGIRCFCCKQRGHLAANCPDFQLGLKGERKRYLRQQSKMDAKSHTEVNHGQPSSVS